MPPRFSANLGLLWPDRPLLERVEAAARAGFRAIELHWPYETPAVALKARCAAHGVRLLSVNTPAGDAGRGEFGLGALPGREVEFRDGFLRCLDYAREAGAQSIHVMAGVTGAGDKAAATQTFLANLDFACRAAPDLTLLLEPMNPHDRPGYFYSSTDEAAGLIARLGAPNVKIMFDAYHRGRSGGDILAEIERHLPDIGHVQIAAVPRRHEPDDGGVDFGAMFAALDRLGYGGWIGCEYLPRGDTDAGLAWMERYGVSL